MTSPAQGTVGYLGPEGSFTHQAALSYISPHASLANNNSTDNTNSTNSTNADNAAPSLLPLSTISAVFHAVANGSVETGIVPIENSTNGAVYPTLDLFAAQVAASAHPKGTETSKELDSSSSSSSSIATDVGVAGEILVPVEHCLLAPASATLASLTAIHTHPQAWTQCARFLSTLPAQIERCDASSTSRAAELAALDARGRTGALASRVAARVTGLEILEAGVQDREDNVTRFVVLRRRQGVQVEDGEVKGLLAFTIEHARPGALAEALGVMTRRGLNLSSINTRPSGLEAWGYVFFVEVLCADAAMLRDAMGELGEVTSCARFLGSWHV